MKVLIACEESQEVCKAFPGIAHAMATQWGVRKDEITN